MNNQNKDLLERGSLANNTQNESDKMDILKSQSNGITMNKG